jgi:hypothetical protein
MLLTEREIMPVFYTTVIIKTETLAEAEQVISERIDYDQDYGFDYQISALPVKQGSE